MNRKTIKVLVKFSTILSCAFAFDLEKEAGHLKPFGYGRPNHPVEEVTEFPAPKEFFEKYVLPMKPVLMKGVGNYQRAFNLWTDGYFLSKNSEFIVASEPFAKQIVNQPVKHITFQEFVTTYNNSGHYMVNVAPDFLL